MLRVGLGYDLHRLVPGRDFILGGIKIESPYGSEAHSDGDVFIHALVDSLLSPVGAPDIGQLFPDTDEKFKGIKSTDILKEVIQRFFKNIKILNIDGVIILDSPKISQFVPDMKKKLSAILGISENQIGIKGKTTENTRSNTVESYVVSLLDI